MIRTLCMFALLTTTAIADEASTLFEQGNRAYEAGRYAEAAASYEKIIAAGRENWQLYYNLGNAYFKQRQLGRAILNYERARLLNPENEDVRFNLELANLSVIDRVPVPPRSLIVGLLEDSLHAINLRTAAMVTAGLWVLLFAILIARLLARGGMFHRLGQRLLWPGLTLWLVFAAVFGWQLYEKSSYEYAIVLASRVVATSAPSPEATEVFTLHEGVRVQLESTSGDYRRIRLADGKVGWMPQSALARI